MPAIKVRPSKDAQKRDFWGDSHRGQLFEEQINKKFGDHFGSRTVALDSLKLQRRLFNMYITGERAIPDAVWSTLRRLPNYVAPIKGRFVSAYKQPQNVPRASVYIDDTDPLS